MGRNKKVSRPVVGGDDSDSEAGSGSDSMPTTAPPAVAAPSAEPAPTTICNVGPTALWVEVCKSDKKKPTTFCRGLAAHGHKLPATAAQLKKMVGPAEVVKDESDCMEFQGDVVEKLMDVLASKLNVPHDVLTQDRAKSEAAAQKAQKKAAVSDGSKKGATAETGNSDSEDDDDVIVTRKKAVHVDYCPVCTFPAEMCEYSGVFEKCKPWLMEQLAADEAAKLADAEEKGRKRRILTDQEKLDKILSGTGKKKVDQVIVLDRKTVRGKKKITTIVGLDLFSVNLTDASREFKKIFSCGAGVVEEVGVLPLIEVQGDVIPQLVELLPKKYPQISLAQIFVMDGKQRVAATTM
jgi:density-regulated protein DRP1